MGNWIFTFGSNIWDSVIGRDLRNADIPYLPDDILRLIARHAPVEFSWTCKKLNQYWKSNIAIFDNGSENHGYLENIRYLRIINWNYWKKYNFAGIAKNLQVLLINVPSTIFDSNFDIVDAFDCPEIKFCFYAPMWSGTYEIDTIDKKISEYYSTNGRNYKRTYMNTTPHRDGRSFWSVKATYKKI